MNSLQGAVKTLSATRGARGGARPNSASYWETAADETPSAGSTTHARRTSNQVPQQVAPARTEPRKHDWKPLVAGTHVRSSGRAHPRKAGASDATQKITKWRVLLSSQFGTGPCRTRLCHIGTQVCTYMTHCARSPFSWAIAVVRRTQVQPRTRRTHPCPEDVPRQGMHGHTRKQGA